MPINNGICNDFIASYCVIGKLRTGNCVRCKFICANSSVSNF